MGKDTTIKLPEGNISINDVLNDVEQLINPRKAQQPPRAEEVFPIDILPLKAQELIRGAEAALGMNAEFLAVSIIMGAAGAAGNAARLEVKRGYYQKANFYAVLIGNPNSNKSAAAKLGLQPIYNHDGEAYERFTNEKAEFEALAAMSKADREAERGTGELPPKPIYKRRIASDTTPEALAQMLLDNPLGLLIHRDELAAWIKDFNRYHNGSDIELWLMIWNGQELVNDRATKGPVRIKNCFVGVFGTIQPSALETLATQGKAQNGFIDRLLFCWPEGITKPLWSDAELNDYLPEAYHNAVDRLLNIGFTPENEPHNLKLTTSARNRLFAYFNDVNKPLCDNAPNELLAGMYGKFDIHILRLALTLELLHWAYSSAKELPQEVGLETVERAIKAGEYFRGQSLKVYNRLHDETPVERLPKDRQAIYEALPAEFTTKDGQAIAQRKGMTERTFKRWLNDKALFEKVRRGEYAKLY